MWKVSNNSFKNPIRSKNFVYLHCLRKFTNASQSENENEKCSEWENAKPYESVPGPGILQLIRNSFPGGKYYNIDLQTLFKRVLDEYGPIAKFPTFLGNKENVIVADTNDFELLFRNEGIWPYRRGMQTFDHYRKEVRPDIFKDMGGLLSEQGEAWHKMRSIVSPIMLKPATVNAYIPNVDEIAIEFCDRMKTLRDDKNEMPSNFLYELSKWALESISSIALDQRLHVLETSKSDVNNLGVQLIKSVDDFFVLSYQLEVQPSLWRYIATPKYKQIIKVFDNMTESLVHFVDKAIDNLEKNPNRRDEDREPSVLEKLLKVDRHVALVMALDMLLAGVDTTSASSTNCLYYLAKNPEKQEKLRKEVQAIPVDANGKLMPSSFQSVPYLRACIKEAMRMAPIIPGTTRAPVKDIVIKGYKIPKGTDIVMANILLHYDSQYFQNPNEFLPERWLRKETSNTCPVDKKAPFVYLPFGFGSRSCVGKRFAEMEMNVLLTRLLRKYRIEYDYGPLKYRFGFISAPVSDLKFRITEI
ncbi:cytochrome P450 CYP12A2-like isoform X1 [Bradysia coprophila]|uniref:cytochrome P450 CYP12A2-like isoform X1 n=1 Tax=Bradysia coprophila TaxID=38358 RepID=UPI00187D6EB8|nr:cytochrome P450 CYP12A2-like isoform X1 [Bradysia coprophila]